MNASCGVVFQGRCTIVWPRHIPVLFANPAFGAMTGHRRSTRLAGFVTRPSYGSTSPPIMTTGAEVARCCLHVAPAHAIAELSMLVGFGATGAGIIKIWYVEDVSPSSSVSRCSSVAFCSAASRDRSHGRPRADRPCAVLGSGRHRSRVLVATCLILDQWAPLIAIKTCHLGRISPWRPSCFSPSPHWPRRSPPCCSSSSYRPNRPRNSPPVVIAPRRRLDR